MQLDIHRCHGKGDAWWLECWENTSPLPWHLWMSVACSNERIIYSIYLLLVIWLYFMAIAETVRNSNQMVNMQWMEKYSLCESDNYWGNASNTSRYISFVSAAIEATAFWIFVSPVVNLYAPDKSKTNQLLKLQPSSLYQYELVLYREFIAIDIQKNLSMFAQF